MQSGCCGRSPSGRRPAGLRSFPGAGVERAGTSVPNYFDRLAFTEVLESQSLYRFEGFKVGSGPSAEDVRSLEVTPSFFRVLRAQAVRGRLFTDDEGEVGHNHVALLSHTFAAKQAGGPRHRRRTLQLERRAVSRRRRSGAGLRVPRSGRAHLHAAGVRCKGPFGGSAPQPEPSDDWQACGGRHGGAGTGTDRCPEPADHRTSGPSKPHS